MFCNKGTMGIAAKASWLLTSFGAISLGLAPFGYNLVEKLGMMISPSIINPLYYLIGIAGVMSLVSFFAACSKDCKR